MNDTIVVSNLRLPRSEWAQIKALAAEAQMSVNEYIRFTLNAISSARSLTDKWLHPKKRKLTIWDLPKLARGEDHPMGLSAEDEIIYGD